MRTDVRYQVRAGRLSLIIVDPADPETTTMSIGTIQTDDRNRADGARDWWRSHGHPDAEVHRHTHTVEVVGLRWEETLSGWSLYDDPNPKRLVLVIHGTRQWEWWVPDSNFFHDGFATLDEAKAAAESAVRESWSK